MSHALGTAALLDAAGRFVSNVGVPAAIALLVLLQITPRMDAQTEKLGSLQTAIAIETAACGLARPLATPAP